MIPQANQSLVGVQPYLPDVNGAVRNLFQNIQVGTVSKTQVNGYTQEVINYTNILGDVQTLNNRELLIKPEGQRGWRWKKLHCTPDVTFQLDDIVYLESTKFRVMALSMWTRYGYQEIHLAEDFTTYGYEQ